MKIEGSVALVTGANRHNGIGRAIVEALLRAGVKKIYATGRDIKPLAELASEHPDVVFPLSLDITDTKQINAAAAQAGDVNLLINNAGIALFAGLVAEKDLTAARTEMEVNYFGTLAMIRAFAPVLKTNGGGAIVNIASIASIVNFPVLGSYSASKAAEHSMTQGVRAELAGQGTRVIGIFPGPVETDMAKNFDMEKVTPSQISVAVLAAIAEGNEDVFPDDMAAEVYANFMNDPKAVEKELSEMLPTT
ncbi:MAG: SDR family oxidoreductase [Rhodospirillaceae bacterium]|jgi:NAD(P)-dependent dehydrogenase (short-subunit alcohol dehydrogenase family)|nr:SDR family oxidoreductase [Rhodospirillaceae bacterium]MBT5752407.1 SDR family oxidoreductase [Rhodospirillaceae bacterium]